MEPMFEFFTQLGCDPFKQAALSASPGQLSPEEQELLGRWKRGEVPGFPGLGGFHRAALFADPGPDSLPDPDVPEYAG